MKSIRKVCRLMERCDVHGGGVLGCGSDDNNWGSVSLIPENSGNENKIFKHFIKSFSKYFSTNLVHYVLTYVYSIDVHELNPKLN